jgi:hypothetical protein
VGVPIEWQWYVQELERKPSTFRPSHPLFASSDSRLAVYATAAFSSTLTSHHEQAARLRRVCGQQAWLLPIEHAPTSHGGILGKR